MKAPEDYVCKREAAKIMGCGDRTIDNWMRRKMIPFYKFGKRVFFKRDELLNAVNNHRIEEGTKHFEVTPHMRAWDRIVMDLNNIKERDPDQKHQNLAKEVLAFITRFDL